jgi:hypothetical protein
MRILGLLKSDEASEAGEMPDAEFMGRMAEFMEEVTKAGILLASDGLKPSKFGKRVKLNGGKVSVIDGPFTESKELVASYALFETKTFEEAVEWTTRFLKVLGGGECELRPIYDFSDFPPDLVPAEVAEKERAWREDMEQRAGR